MIREYHERLTSRTREAGSGAMIAKRVAAFPSAKAHGWVLGLSLCPLLAGAVCAQVPADGLYLRSDDPSAPSVSSDGGQRVPLGRSQELAREGTEIFAEDNANTRFWVTVRVPYDTSADFTSYVLVVSNRAYPSIGGGGGSGNGVYTMDFRVAGKTGALEVSRYLSTPVAYRRHPGQLFVSFTATKDSFRIGDEVRATLRIENVGTSAISFLQGGHYRGSPRDNQYTFAARFLGRQIQDVGSSDNHGGIAAIRVLKAGEVFEDEISLSKWFAFDRAGSYEVLGSYEMTFYEPETVLSKPIWADYLSGAFVVKIDDR